MYDVRDHLKPHVYGRSERVFAARDAARDATTTRQRELRAFLIASLGDLPPMDTALEPQIVGAVEGKGFRVEKVIFQSRPRHYVTANLYLPDGLDKPHGAVLFLSGHGSLAKAAPEYQIVCQRERGAARDAITSPEAL